MGELQWIAQFSQLSASAALTGVLGWMLYQMPKHFREERESREKVAAAETRAREKVAEAHAQAVAVLVEEAKQRADTDRQARERVADVYAKSIDAIIEAGKEEAKFEREACERRHKETMEASERRHAEMVERIDRVYAVSRDIKHETAGLAQAHAMHRAAEDMKQRRPKKEQEGA